MCCQILGLFEKPEIWIYVKLSDFSSWQLIHILIYTGQFKGTISGGEAGRQFATSCSPGRLSCERLAQYFFFFFKENQEFIYLFFFK